jgi:hypothetical protein
MTHTVGVYTQAATATPAAMPIGTSSQLRECFAWLSNSTATTAGASQDPPMSEQLAAEIREALARVERGQVVDLGDFAQYADDGED